MEAYLYRAFDQKQVQCLLCNHRCMIKTNRKGVCGVRQNEDGVLETLVYGRLVAANVDPIEKKPLFHLLPGSRSYSIATVGCNFRCRFCQNAGIAQMPIDRRGMIAGDNVRPQDVVAAALRNQCKSIAYTYTEPTVYFEFAYDTAKLAHARGLKNIFVTNGYMSAEALEMITPFLDAANVDLKAFREDFYERQCGAKLEPVKETLRLMKASGVLVEITTLLIPGLNDDPEELKALAHFIVDALGAHTPWHISRFYPTYRLNDRPATPAATLQAAFQIGKDAGLRYVYLGNTRSDTGQSTLCHQCGALLIERSGFSVRANHISNDHCPQCGAPVYGIGMSD